jgi:L-asparaginase
VLQAVVDAGAKGIVLATAGAGATAGTQREGIRYAIDKQTFVVTTTRTGSGRIAGGRGRGGGPTFSIAGDDLTPVKARILLMLAIATTQDGSEIQRMFREY